MNPLAASRRFLTAGITHLRSGALAQVSPDELRAAATELRATAADLDRVLARLSSSEDHLASTWPGMAAETFRESWHQLRAPLTLNYQALVALAEVVDKVSHELAEAHAVAMRDFAERGEDASADSGTPEDR